MSTTHLHSSGQKPQDTGWTKTRYSRHIRNAVNWEIKDRTLCEGKKKQADCVFVAWVNSPAGASGGGFESPGRVFEIKKNTVPKKKNSANYAQNIPITGSQAKVKHCTF